MDEAFALNLRNWEERTAIHLRDSTGFYNIAGFLAGEDALTSIEASEIGDVGGRSLVHLQCHFGLDTLSLARRGARVTGLDFSPAAIAAARDLARRAGIEATFVEGNVYDAPSLAPGPFDIAFVNWGAVNWLPDIAGWGRVVASLLASGGRLYFADGHPAALMLDEVGGRLQVSSRRLSTIGEPVEDGAPDDAVTYTGDATPLVHAATRTWTHTLSAIVTALTDAGLAVEMLHEHEAVPWQIFPMAVRGPDRLYRLPDNGPHVPLAVTLGARKR